jgi:predicted Zn-dependent peptidase
MGRDGRSLGYAALRVVMSLVIGGCATATSPSPAAAVPPAVVTEPAADDLLSAPLPGDPLGVTVHALSNGMRVYISRDSTRPTIDAHVVIRAGARQEPEDATELAHYLEHMMFKGTDRLGTTDWEAEEPHLRAIARLYDELAGAKDDAEHARIEAEIDRHTQAAAAYVAPNEVWTLFQALGVTRINARTGSEVTVYDVWGLPHTQLRTWAEIEAERFRAPAFRLFFPELEAVFEEYNLHEDELDWRQHNAVARVVWADHPNARASNSKPEHLRTPAYGAMVGYFRRWYVPSNIAVVLVGDVDPAAALPELEATLGALPSGPRPTKARAPVEQTAAGRTETVIGERAGLSLLWSTVPAGHNDAAALDVANRLLMDAQSGLLVELFYRPNRLADARSYHDTAPEGGYFQLTADVQSDQTHEEVRAELLRAVARLRAGEFEASALDAIVLRTEIDDEQRFEDPDARTEEILASLMDEQTWRERVAAVVARRTVTKADIVRVSRKYLAPADAGSVVTEVGEPTLNKLRPPKITPLSLDYTARSAMARTWLERQVEPLQPVFAEPGRDFLEVGAAPPSIAVENTRNELFSVTHRFERGTADDPRLCFALDLLEIAGTPSQTREQFDAALASLGASVWTECGERTASLWITGIDRNFDATVELVRPWLLGSRAATGSIIQADRLTSEVHEEIESRRTTATDPTTIAQALWEHALRGEASPFRARASEAELRATTAADVSASLRALLASPHRTLYYGPREGTRAIESLALGLEATGHAPSSPQSFARPSEPVIYVVDVPAATSQIWITYPGGVAMHSGDADAFLADEYYAGGMASLLLQELREARALVYTASAWTVVAEHPGDDSAMLITLLTAGAKTAETLREALSLMRAPIDPERFASAKQVLIEGMRKHRPEPRELAAQIARWRAYGHTDSPERMRWQTLCAADYDAAHFEDFRRRLVAPAPLITIVGNIDELDMRALERLGTVKVVDRQQLFR